MADKKSLTPWLQAWAGDNAARADIGTVISRISEACIEISSVLATGEIETSLAETTGKRSGVDLQKKVDVVAHNILVAALKSAPVFAVASEELDDVLQLREGGPLCVALDPIDGSSNLAVNGAVGTIFSIFPYSAELTGENPKAQFLRRGLDQVAAGFFVYGPQTTLALTVGIGTDIFTLDPEDKSFKRTRRSVVIPATTAEYAINASNYGLWDQPIRTYISDCHRGRSGPRDKDFNMRWTASPVVDIYRILNRGGVFLYPGDLRPGYKDGRLRTIYEAFPLAMIIEQASGAASTGHARILETIPKDIHQHTPVVAGSREEVAYIMRLHREPLTNGERSPLFRNRGLFRS